MPEEGNTLICVYESNCTDFSNNGLGLVTPQSCTVTETLNGEWELTLVHPIDDYGKWQRLTEGRILRAPVPAAMTPQVNLVTQQYQTATYDILVYKVSTNKDPLRLRSGTGTKYKILGKYKKGTEVIVLNKTTSSWYEVTCPDGKHGYMSAQYLTYVRTDTGTTQTNVGFTNEVVESRQLRDQPFRIYRVVPDLGKITVYARHIFYDLIDNMIQSVKPASDAVGASVVKNLSDGCLTEHDFTFYSDLKTTADAAFENINPVEALLGEGGITDAYHAELARDWFDVFLVSRVGADTDVQIREKKNLTGISYDVDETDAVTRIMPTGEDADGNLLYLPELYIDSPNIGAYHQPKWVHLAVAEAKEVTEGDETRSKSECYAIMRKAVQAEYDAGCDLPTVTLSVDFVNCADAEEYREYAALSNIFLGDSVRVIARRIGVEVTMRMTQYTYDCLTRKYTAVTLGTAAATLENTTVAARQLASGSISGAKLMLGSIGSGHLQSGSVGSLQVKAAAIGAAHIQNAAISSAHIQDAAIQSAQIADAAITSAKIGDAAIGSAHIQNASITSAHIAAALVDVLNVNALNAVTARIGELAAGQITTDELYASIAMISVAQLTTANIISANIQWADIESLAADIASISRAQINTANIENANIDWAAITTLTAAVGAITKANIETADIDWSHIKDLATDTAIITQGTAGQLYISRLAVTEANMASLTVGELVVKGSDGHFYSVSVDKNGEVVTALKQVVNDDVADLSIHGTEKLIEGSITARTLNVQEIFGDNATIRSLIAANIDVDTLFAREATITALNAMDITSNTYLRLMVDRKADQTDVDAIEDRLSAAELKITEGAIVSTVTRSETYTSDLAAVQSAADNAQSSANAAKTAASNAQSAADAAQRSIDGLSVGGRNLILRSATQDKAYGNAREGAELMEGETCLGCNVFRTSMAWMDIGVNLTRLINTHGLKAGDVVTYSIYNKSDDTVARKYSCFYSPPSTTDSGSKALLTLDDRLHTEWTRLVCTFTITEDIMGVAKAGTTMPLRFECHTANTEGTYQYWAAPKLELGNVATDWTPAPEDLTDGIDAAQSAADGAQSAADANAATISALATRVTTAEQKITADAIVSTVTQSETYATDLSALQSAADSAQSTANTAQMRADAAQSTASAAQSAAAKAQTAADAAQSSIDGLSVGGRNLFENSANLTSGMFGQYSCPEKVYSEGEDAAVPSGKYIALTLSLDADTVYQGGPYLFSKNALTNVYPKLIDGETYTVSVWAKCSTEKTIGKQDVEFLTDKVSQRMPALSTEWQRYVITGVFDASLAYSAITFYYGSQWDDGDVFYLSSPQVEIGNMATDWTPAPEDTVTGIATAQSSADNAQSTADAAQSTASANTASISALATRVTTAEQKITADAIVSTVTKSETYTTDLAAVQAAANNAQSSADTAQSTADAARSSIDSLDVGGRNLLLANNVLITGSNAIVVKDAESNGYILTSTTTDGWARAVTKQHISVEAGAQYTLSARFKDASEGKDLGRYSLVNGWLYQGGEHCADGYSAIYSLDGNRAIFTMTFDDLDGELTFQPWFYCNNQAGTNAAGNRITFYDIKFERGNRATDWTPAPEDVDASIETAQNTADAAQSAADTAQSTADANTSSISALTTRVASAEQKITADAIVSTVRSSTTYKADIAAVQSAADAARSSADAAQAAADSIDVGGRNLLPNTQAFFPTSGSGALTGETYRDLAIRYLDCTAMTSGYKELAGWNNVVYPEYGEVYTLSFYAKGNGKMTTYFYGASGYVTVKVLAVSTAATYSTGYSDGNCIFPLTGEWTRYWVTYQCASSGDTTAGKHVLFRLWYGNEAYVCGAKLEKGNRATDWSPAAEDVADGIGTAQRSADAAQSAADANKANISALTTRMTSAEQKITADAIVSTVRSSSAYTTDLAGKASVSAVTAAQSAADAAQNSADAAQSSIDNLSVGGRNLIQGSATQNTAYGNVLERAERASGETYLGCNVYRSALAWADIGTNLTRIINTYGLKAGDVLTYSIYNKTDDAVARNLYCYYSPTSTTVSSAKTLYSFGSRLFTEWTRLVCTFTITEDMMGVAAAGSAMWIRFESSTANTDGTYQYWAAPKLELGNVATDWSPAPEDAEEGIAVAQSSADAAQSAANANAANISALTTRVASAEQKITADAIVSTVRSSSAYTTDLAGKASVSAVTAAQSAANAAKNSADAAQSSIDSLKVGGRNLLRETREYTLDSTRAAGWYKASSLWTFTKDDEGFAVANCVQSGATTNNIPSLYSSRFPVKTGDTLIYSCWFMVDDVSAWDSQQVPYIFEVYDSAGTRIQYQDVKITSANTNLPAVGSGEWVHFYSAHTVTIEGAVTAGMRVSLFRNGSLHVKKCMAEFGTIPTDWSPAPEDAETGIAAAQSSADAAQSTADANTSSISALTTRVTSAEQKITADAIVSTVRSSSAYTVDLAGKASVSAVTAAQSAANAAQADIDGLQIGGRNLIVGSSRYRKHSPLSNTSTAKDGIITNQYLYMPCTPGETYTFQCKTDGVWGTHDTSGNGGGRTHLYLYLQTADEIGSYASYKTPKDIASSEYNGKTGLGVWTYTVPTTYAYERIRFRFDIHSDGSTSYTVKWWDLKAEKGNVATDWTPPPEDVDNDIAAAQTTANSAQSAASTAQFTANTAKSTASANASNISALTTRMTSAESSISQNANQIALKVSASTYNTEKLYRGTTAPTTLYTNMLWLDLSLSPPILKRYTGSAWVAVGAQDVKNSGITITSNDVSITTENFLLQLLDPADNENVLMEMSADGNVGFKELYADEVISDSVAQAYFGPSAIYISPTYTGTSDTYFRSLGDAVKVLNNRFLKSDVTIYLPYGTETYESSGVFIKGISGPGRLRIYGYADSSILNSYIQVKGCFAHIYFQNVHLRESRSMNGTSYQPYLVELQMNHYVEFYNCTLDANSVTYDSVYSKGSYVYLNSCGLYNALQGLEVFTGLAFMLNCCGSCSWSMVSYAGVIMASGTVPAGSKGSGNNGQVYSSNTTVDYGTAIPVVTPDETCVLYATTTKSWRGSWRTDTVDVIQGVYYESGYSSSLNWNRGCMWFSALKSVLSGCTVKSATLTLHRKTGSGSSAAKTVYLCAISNTSASGTPSIKVNYGALGTIGRNKQVTFSIPVAAVQGLADGTYGGLCLYETPYNFGSSTYSSCYMRMSGTDTDYEPYLTVVYSGSTAVG